MKKISFALILFQLLTLNLSAQQPLVFRGGNMVMGQYVSVLEDPESKHSIESVQHSKEFVKSAVEAPTLELSKSFFWLKFSVKNESPETTLLLSLAYPNLDVCEFYYPLKNGKYALSNYSDNRNFNLRKYNHQNFIFDINIPKGKTSVFYLKVQSSEQMLLPIILGTPQNIAESTLTNDLLWGILTGILVVMIFYNFFVYISTKDRSYLYYVLYTSFTLLTQTTLSGYTYRFIFTDSPLLFNNAIVLFPGLAGISGVLFITSFLHTRERTPKLHKIFGFAILLYSIAVILRITGFDLASYRMIDVSAIFSIIVIYILAISISLQGYRPAKFFLLAWSVFFIGLIFFVLRNLGILPYNNYTNYTMQVGTAFEATLLSLALADRINIFKAEKEKSQEETLKALQENERIILEQNVVLESKVNERTAELNQSNNELQLTLEDLKQAQSQLVESEKMASLGQLTAGIAHEINNPINFVTSNVTPLKRDVDLLLEAIETVENIGLSDASASEKQQQIEDFKEELDFDYLKIEINHLLKGIHEGASRTAEIVKGLRIFSRVDEDDLKIADINEGIDSTLVIANNLLTTKINVTKDYNDIPHIECYPGKLNQVFLNIISNAAHAILKRHTDGGGELKISTGINNNCIVIKIKDNGMGMDANAQKKIFEPFFTTKDVGEGTGLGMSIAYNTIKKHNGNITFNSVENEGTEFIIELPVIHEIKAT